jgi:hypothetical protein
MARWWSKRDDLVEVTNAKKVSSARSVELITLLNTLVVFTHIIRIAACKEYTDACPITLVEKHVSGRSMSLIMQEGR